MPKGWNSKYKEIIKEFNYSQKKDKESAARLESQINNKKLIKEIKNLIENQSVCVIGSGPSIGKSISFLKNKKIIKIVADSAVKPLVDNGIKPDIVITDLDGDLDTLKKIGRTKTIFVTHAHGDNISKLNFVKNFKNCIGTTQSKPFGKLYNFGGFTDGDRAVFFANYFGARKIILFGMDFGKRIGRFSNTKSSERMIKLKKLEKGKSLLEWLASNSKSQLFTTSSSIKGFQKIKYSDLDYIIT